MTDYLRQSVSNGIPSEQALIRRWWHEEKGARGRIVWEYHLEGFYVDAIWFPEAPGANDEEAGRDTTQRFPVRDQNIVLCEAKSKLTPELVGQAMVYSELARRAGANLISTIVFAGSGLPQMKEVAQTLGLKVVV